MASFAILIFAALGLGALLSSGSDDDVTIPDENRIDGTDADETLMGSRGDDIINGYGGNDTLRGGEGDDSLHSGSGFRVRTH